MGDDRPNVYGEDGPDGWQWVYRASAVGGCSRALLYARLGMTGALPPDWLQDKYDQGNVGEDVVVKMMEDDGWKFESRQDEVELELLDGIVVRGHTDGVATDKKGKQWLIEIKCLDMANVKKTDKTLKNFPTYRIQTSLYSHASKLPCMMVLGCKGTDGTVGTLKYIELDIDAREVVREVKLKLAAIEKAAGKSQPAMLCDYGGVEGAEQYPCPFYELHDDKPDAELVDDDVLDKAVNLYHDAKDMEKMYAEMKKTAAVQIAEWFDAQGKAGSKVATKLWEIADVIATRKGSLDPELVEAKGYDLTDCYGPGSESRYPKLKERKQTAEK